MGQGAESCGGYEVEYDPHGYDESNGYKIWSGQSGEYNVSSMTVSHMKNCIRLCERKSMSSSFSSDSEKWDDWVNVFETEILFREKPKKKVNPKKDPEPVRGKTKLMKCHCGNEYKARVADLNRGWGLSCSKRCAAIRKKYKKKKAVEVAI